MEKISSLELIRQIGIDGALYKALDLQEMELNI